MTGVNFDLQPFVGLLTSRSRLSKIEEDALLALPTQQIEVNRHKDFVTPDQTVDHVSVVVDGVVGRFSQMSDGERQITALHITGDAPDLHTVVLHTDTYPLQALSNATILRVPHGALRTIAARYPAIAEAFWRHCSVDTAITAQWVVNVTRRDSRMRISHLLCEMAVRYEADGGTDVSFPFPLTQTQIGEATGITSVHVNRSVKGLAEQGLAFVADQVVRIPDWDRLAEYAEFDARYLQAKLQPGERLRIVDQASAKVR